MESQRFPRSSTLCCLVLLFVHSGADVISCDMRKHVLCPSWPNQSSAVSPPSYPPPPKHPEHPLPCILCVYEHRNAIRPSKTPLVPGLVGPTVAVHSQPPWRWLFLTTGPLLQLLWKITPEKSHSWGKNTRKCKTDRTTGADNTRQNTITLHQVTVGHCNCLRQQRDGGGGNCRVGGVSWLGQHGEC